MLETLRQRMTWLKYPLKVAPRRAVRGLIRAVNHGTARFCPCCETGSRRFMAFRRREDAQCIHCGALERHRFVWFYIKHRTDLFGGRRQRTLHVAPEACLEPLFKAKLGSEYVTGDLNSPAAMVRLDVTNIGEAEGSYDVIYCSHVLEHVPNDAQALREFYRVLKPGGWALLLVPVIAERTVEDPTIVRPEDRLRHYGHRDHVRAYGPDFADRARSAGFSVDVIFPRDVVSAEERVRMGLTAGAGEIFLCKKPHRGAVS